MNFLQHWLVVALAATASALLACGAVLAGDQAITARLASAWSGAEVSQSRLIVAHAPHHHGKKLLAGLQLKLDAGWFTYWRTPGESGAPPEFDWSDSENVADVKVLWPRPQQVKVSNYTINGYPSGVVLPLVVTPEDPEQPMVLHVKVTYAVCRDVCVPVTAEHVLPLEAIESAAEKAREQARQAAREARERAQETAEAAREQAQEARERAQEQGQEARERAEETAAEARAQSEEKAQEVRERIQEAIEIAREKAEEFLAEAQERAEEQRDESPTAQALEEKAIRLAEATEAHARTIEEKANKLAEMHAKVIEQNAEGLTEQAEAQAQVLEDQAETLAQAAEQLAEAYSDLISHYVDMVPDSTGAEKKIETVMGEVAETGGRRAIEIKIYSDNPINSPQVFVEAGDKIVFGTVESTVSDNGRTIIVLAPVSRAKGPVDGRWVTVTIVDGQIAIEKRLKIAPRNVVTLPWPAVAAPSPDRPGEATPPLAALPE